MGKRSLIFVSSYPEFGVTHSAKTVGVASYTKQLVQELKKQLPDDEIKVFAETLGESDAYTEDGVMVERSWIRGSLISLLYLLKTLSVSTASRIVVAFEINMFGNIFHATAMLMGLACLRLLGKRIALILHQVPAKDWKIGVSFYYLLVKWAATKIVVFEDYLAELLGDTNQVRVVPHAIPIIRKIEKKLAREKLGWEPKAKYVLLFGYIAPYKGVERLVENWQESEDTKLIIAGGMNPNHASNKDIVKYVMRIEDQARARGVQVTGFVPEEMMEHYFAGCDVVVIPYEMMFSSSGPLAWAMACGKSVLLSNELEPYLMSSDIATALQEAGIKREDMIVNFDHQYDKNIAKAINDREKWEEFGKIMQNTRSIQRVGKKLAEVIGET